MLDGRAKVQKTAQRADSSPIYSSPPLLRKEAGKGLTLSVSSRSSSLRAGEQDNAISREARLEPLLEASGISRSPALRVVYSKDRRDEATSSRRVTLHLDGTR